MDVFFGKIKGVAEHLLETDGVPPANVLPLFALEEGDGCLHHFNCALHTRIPLQGKLYVYPSRLCFFSRFNSETIVGTEPTVLVLPHHQIKRVSKKKGPLFNNEIVIEMEMIERQYVFTSFLQRDRALRAITCIVEQAKDGYMERLWLQEALKLIEDAERHEQEEKKKQQQIRSQAAAKDLESSQYDEIGLDDAQNEDLSSLYQIIGDTENSLQQQLEDQKQQWSQIKEGASSQKVFSDLFRERRVHLDDILSTHQVSSGGRLKWQSVQLPDVSVNEVFCLIFGNKTYTHAKTKKAYQSFLYFYMQECLKETQIVISEIAPPPPEIFDSPYSQNLLQLVDAPLTSTRTFTFQHPIPKMLFMPDRCNARIAEKLHWISDEEILLERTMNVSGIVMADAFEVRVLFHLSGTKPEGQQQQQAHQNACVEVKCASYVHFKKNTVLKGTIESGEKEQFDKCWLELKKLLAEETALYCAQRLQSANQQLLVDSMPNSFVRVAKSEEAPQEAKIQNKNNENNAAAAANNDDDDDEEWQEIPLDQQLEQVGETLNATKAACAIF